VLTFGVETFSDFALRNRTAIAVSIGSKPDFVSEPRKAVEHVLANQSQTDRETIR
jgi:hypothetical protein